MVAEAERQRGQEPVLRDDARSLARRCGLLVCGHVHRGHRHGAVLLLGESPHRIRHHRPVLDNIGWRARVQFTPLVHRIRPKDQMGCWPLLPDRYAPLQANGNGIQSIYLIEVSETFAQVLAGIIGADAQGLIAAVPVGAPMQMNDDLDYWEHKIESGIAGDTTVTETEREAIIRARRGQGLFKQRVMEIEEHCRITGISNPVHLIVATATLVAVRTMKSESMARMACF